MGLFCIFMFVVMADQIPLPGYDSGAPSPRIIPSLCLGGMLICAAVLIIQSLLVKKEHIYVFEFKKELPVIVLVVLLCVYSALIIYIGFILASVLVCLLTLFLSGERKPAPYIVAAVFAVLIFFLFQNVFRVSLPVCGLKILGRTI